MESIVWRPQWLSPVAALAYTIGLGNVWRFPYLCYTHGGFMFLVPYCFILLLVVYPLLLLQMVVGQYCGRGGGAIYGNVAPLAAGLGWSLVLLESIITVYYNVQVSWILYYIFGALIGQPWTSCENHSSTENCVSLEMLNNATIDLPNNETFLYSTEEYYYYGLLGSKSKVWTGFGSMQMKVMACLVASWALVFLLLSNDIYAAKKVITSSIVIPWILLLVLVSHVLLFRCVSGTTQSTDLDWSPVYEFETWKAAAMHAFKSFGLILSGVTSMASHNTVLRNILLDAAVIVVMDTLTGILSYVVVSYTLECLDDPRHTVSSNHMLLAFVTYPMAVARLDMSVVWVPLFFFTFLTIGLSCQAMMVLSVTINLKDRWPSLWLRQYMVLGLTCSLLLALGLPLCTHGGDKLVHLLANATGGPATFLLCLLAACFLAYGCGFVLLSSIMTDTLQLWMPSVIRYYLKFTWMFFTPVSLSILFICSAYSSATDHLQDLFWGDVTINVAFVIPFVGCALHRLCTHDGPWRDLVRPTADFKGGNRCRYPSAPPCVNLNGVHTHVLPSSSASNSTNVVRNANNTNHNFVRNTLRSNLQPTCSNNATGSNGRLNGAFELGDLSQVRSHSASERSTSATVVEETNL